MQEVHVYEKWGFISLANAFTGRWSIMQTLSLLVNNNMRYLNIRIHCAFCKPSHNVRYLEIPFQERPQISSTMLNRMRNFHFSRERRGISGDPPLYLCFFSWGTSRDRILSFSLVIWRNTLSKVKVELPNDAGSSFQTRLDVVNKSVVPSQNVTRILKIMKKL